MDDKKLPTIAELTAAGKLPHLILIQESGKARQEYIKDFPTALKLRYNAFNGQEKMFIKNPTLKQQESLIKQSVKIADDTQNWLEKDLPDEDESDQISSLKNEIMGDDIKKELNDFKNQLSNEHSEKTGTLNTQSK